MSDGFESDIAIPSGISPADAAALQRCEGKVLFLPNLHRQLALSDVSHESFAVGGVDPDTLGLLLAYKRRFPAVITRVLPTRLIASPIEAVFPQRSGVVSLHNTSPVDLCNGDMISLMPPVFDGQSTTLRLESLGLTLKFPVTLPSPLAREIVARLVTRGIENLNPDGAAGDRQDTIHYNGARLSVISDVRQLEPVNAEIRSLVLNMVYSITEGTALILALIPRLFSLSAQDGYVNALLHLQSATREAAQLIHPVAPGMPQDGDRRFPVYEALVAWMAHAAQLGDVLALAPVARVCTFDGPTVIRPGDLGPVLRK
ncbi:capsid protein [Leporid alphaherpesvirus 4]|uniref:Capsid protein n=1 Tax=Leporid alphaherpesvirus 4 TaxID=481315 RepID=J9QVC7_9ALPH|nr:capsid protein [Leporid alphaherpesvirus 4]AFR32460.1 capsid protein [Leporid alphaherpesvirus 4]